METQIKKLTRSIIDRKLAEVCGGLAEFFPIDVTIIRVIFVLATVFGGSGLLIQIAMALTVPEKSIIRE